MGTGFKVNNQGDPWKEIYSLMQVIYCVEVNQCVASQFYLAVTVSMLG